MKSDYLENRFFNLFLPAIFLVLSHTVIIWQTMAQAIPDTSKMTYNQISQGLNLYVFPSKGQSRQTQKTDEFFCYRWAMEQSGIDPLNLPKVEAAPVESHVGSKMVKRAAAGAAAGAAIGAIVGDAGEGALIGVLGGAISGRRSGKKEKAQASQQAQANANAQEQELKKSFLKAFTACIEGKGYTVK